MRQDSQLGRMHRRLVTLRRTRDERGAVAVIVAIALVMLVALAAIGVDIASNVAAKHQLKDTMDAAAHAGAYELPDNPTRAVSEALRMARANDASANPAVDLWCVVAASPITPGTPDVRQIPSTCDPGPPPYTVGNYPGMVCNDVLCAIPCVPAQGDKCNTLRLADNKTVPYAFAPAIGYDEGRTGAVVSVACKGSCGTEAPNPMDIVLVADRTASMSWSDRDKMKNAMKSMLTAMSPQMHAVALGTLHKSRTSGFTSKVSAGPPQTSNNIEHYNGHWDGTGDTDGDGRCYTEAAKLETERVIVRYEQGIVDYRDERRCIFGFCWNERVPVYGQVPVYEDRVENAANAMSKGTWVPVPFRTDYLTGGDTPAPNPSSRLVDGISCLPQSKSGEFGTHLASSLKGAARYLLNNHNNHLDRPGNVKKVIIFETDGLPDEVFSSSSTALSLNNDMEIGAGFNQRNNNNGQRGCDNFLEIARQAKNRGIIIITIGFGQAATGGCTKIDNSNSTGTPVRNVLAAAASSKDGVPATASSCRTEAEQRAENTDGDYFFCSTNGSDLEEIFRTAFETVSDGIKFIKMPG